MTDWENRYQTGDTPWDKGGPHPALAHLLPLDVPAQRILVPGCGLGYDMALLAAHPEVEEVVGVDVAASAVAAARTHLADVPNARVEQADLFDLPAAHRHAYDLVWEHTCFCAIDPSMREDYVRAVHSALKPGGHLLGVFYLDPYDDEHQPGGGPPHGSSLEELSVCFEESGRFLIEHSAVPGKAYPGREGLERTVRMRRI